MVVVEAHVSVQLKPKIKTKEDMFHIFLCFKTLIDICIVGKYTTVRHVYFTAYNNNTFLDCLVSSHTDLRGGCTNSGRILDRD